MPIPETTRTVFEENPLAEVGCQIVVPRLLELENESPAEFQKVIADSYPYYRRSYHRPGEYEDPEMVHEFISRDQFWKFSVCSDFVKLSTTDYEDRDQFRREFEPLLDAFVDVYGSERTLASSLYYRDVIDREELGLEGVAWSELLKPPFAGVLSEGEIEEREVADIQQTMTFELSEPPGTARVVHGLHEFEDGRRVYVMDSFLNDERGGTFEARLDRLPLYHDVGGHLFRWAISDRLFEVLNGGRNE